MDVIDQCNALKERRNEAYEALISETFNPDRDYVRKCFRTAVLSYERFRDRITEIIQDMEYRLRDIEHLHVTGYCSESRLFVLPEELVGVIGTFLSGKRIHGVRESETPVGYLGRILKEEIQLLRDYLMATYFD